MNKDIIKMKAKEYADGIRGLTHKKTASVDFEKGAQFVLESMKWRNAEKDPPPLDTRVLVKSSGKFVNTGMLVFDSEHKKNIWICGNTNRAWDINFWKPLPQKYKYHGKEISKNKLPACVCQWWQGYSKIVHACYGG